MHLNMYLLSCMFLRRMEGSRLLRRHVGTPGPHGAHFHMHLNVYLLSCMFLRRVGGSRLLRSMKEHQVHMVHMLHVDHILVHMKHIFTCTIMCTYFPACFYGVWEARDSSEACRNTRYTWSTCST